MYKNAGEKKKARESTQNMGNRQKTHKTLNFLKSLGNALYKYRWKHTQNTRRSLTTQGNSLERLLEIQYKNKLRVGVRGESKEEIDRQADNIQK